MHLILITYQTEQTNDTHHSYSYPVNNCSPATFSIYDHEDDEEMEEENDKCVCTKSTPQSIKSQVTEF